VKLGDGGLGSTADDAARREPDGKSRRAEEHTCDRSSQRTLGRALADRVALILFVHVSSGERPTHHDPVVTVVLDESDLVDPWNIAHGIAYVRVGALGTFGMWKHGERKIEAHALVLLAVRDACNIEFTALRGFRRRDPRERPDPASAPRRVTASARVAGWSRGSPAYRPTGIAPSTRVPALGDEVIFSVPPTAPMRSRMPIIPWPSPLRAPFLPTPSSVTAKWMLLPSRPTAIVAMASSPACLTTFWMALHRAEVDRCLDGWRTTTDAVGVPQHRRMDAFARSP